MLAESISQRTTKCNTKTVQQAKTTGQNASVNLQKLVKKKKRKKRALLKLAKNNTEANLIFQGKQ